MALTFRDPPSFWRETLAVTAGAAACGVLAPAFASSLPVETAAGAAALLGGSVGAALTRARPLSKALRAGIGVVGGVLAALGFAALSTRFGLGMAGALGGGALGGLALGTLLSSDEESTGRGAAQALSLAGAAGMGVLGTAALSKIAAFAAAEGAPLAVSGATMAGALGLWVASASGLRRVERLRDPLVVQSEEVLRGLADPVHARVVEALSTYREIEEALGKDELMGPGAKEEATKNARALVQSILETARSWKQIHGDLSSPRLSTIEDKLKELEEKTAATTDPVTLSHLARATQALHAQQSALHGLRVGRQRAEAAVDAQTALLERLRLAVAQHRASDRERFQIELSAVADQVSRLSDDLESISAAIAEAEAFADRKLLADLERAGRRALSSLAEKEGEAAQVVEVEEATADRR